MRGARLPLPFVLALIITFVGAPAAFAADRDCGDFDTQRLAQRFFRNHNPSADPHSLDSDGDGVACESNPCPCSSRTRTDGGDGTTGSRKIVQRARVVRVIDGDTVDVRRRGRKFRVRMIGIDTPEVYGGTECGGRKASRSLKRMLPRGVRVTLVSDPSQDRRDRYGRQLRYVHRRGHDVNKQQVRRGWARVYVYEGNPFRRTREYRRAQRAAKRHDRGVWRVC